MTRYLSQLLGAREPTFSQSIQQLELASGMPSADIRLSADLMQQARQKIAQLGLDPKDTTGPELYSALHERLRGDEQRVRTALGIAPDATSSDIVGRVQQFVDTLDVSKDCFALKASIARRLLKKKPPKSAMKHLGYRSLDSMLKHEQPAQLYAAAVAYESLQWHKAFREQYSKLSPSDFEQRPMTIVYPKAKRWAALSNDFVAATKQNILCFKELGAIVMLPIDERVEGLATTTLLLVLESMNDIRTQSSYAKLQQVKPNFGHIIQHATVHEPYTTAQLAGQPVPWKMIQRFYGRHQQAYHPEVFEPHVQPEDLQWHRAEDILTKLEPALSFWQDTAALGVLHEGQPVSMNILDVCLSYCNHMSFADRIVHFVRDNLWHELMMRYLNQGNLEEAVHRQLSSELVVEPALAEI
jgi:hypothetical protein